MKVFIILAILFNLYMLWDAIKSLRKTIKSNKEYERKRKPS